MGTDIITQNDIAMAGFSGLMAQSIIGLTEAEAATKYLRVFRLAIAEAMRTGKGVVSYSLQGQSATTSMEEARRFVDFLKEMRSSRGGGGVSIPVQFA